MFPTTLPDFVTKDVAEDTRSEMFLRVFGGTMSTRALTRSKKDSWTSPPTEEVVETDEMDEDEDEASEFE